MYLKVFLTFFNETQRICNFLLPDLNCLVSVFSKVSKIPTNRTEFTTLMLLHTCIDLFKLFFSNCMIETSKGRVKKSDFYHSPPPKKKVITIFFWQLHQFLSNFGKKCILPFENPKHLVLDIQNVRLITQINN